MASPVLRGWQVALGCWERAGQGAAAPGCRGPGWVGSGTVALLLLKEQHGKLGSGAEAFQHALAAAMV